MSISPTITGLGAAKIASRSSLADTAAGLHETLEAGPIGLMSGPQVVALAGHIEELGRQVDALRVTVAGEINARANIDFGEGTLAHQFGCRNSTELMQRVTLVSAATASQRFALARATRPEVGLSGHTIPPKFPAVAAALADHTINGESAEIIIRALSTLPAHIDRNEIAHAEQCLVAASCGQIAPGEHSAVIPEHADNIRVMSRAWAVALDQDGRQPSGADQNSEEQNFEEQQQRRFFRLGRETRGLVPLFGALLPEVAATLGRLVDAINSPRVAGTVGTASSFGSDVSPDAHSASHPSRVRFVEIDDTKGDGTEGDGTELGSNVSRSRNSARRTPDQKRHDALAVVAQAASQHEGMPSLGGAPVTVLIQVEAEQLHTPRGVAWLHGHDGVATPLSITGAAHAACAGAAQRVTQNSDGRIIELGNLQRVFTAHQRRAIALRDGGCVIPGCTVPATWCEIHHVTEHASGGPTHTDNGATLCWFHHRSLSTSGWHIRMQNGTPETLAPPWLDPTRTWRPTHPPHKPPSLNTHRHRDRKRERD